MSSIKKVIEGEKSQLQELKAPEELENRLRVALEREPIRKRKKRIAWRGIAIASILILSLLIVNHHEGLAYYGKKILGFDHVVSETLKDLNEKGMGQVIGESITLQEGVIFTVEGVMNDDNQLIMYYTVEAVEGQIEHKEFQPIRLTGFWTNSYHDYGVGKISGDGKKITGTHSFAPPNGFAKELTLHFLHTEKTLTFTYDPSKALATIIEMKIGQDVLIDDTKLTFKSIKASPTMTLIEGSWEGEIESAEIDATKLYVNNELVTQQGNSYTSNWRGNTFELRYDALSAPVNKIELVLHNGERIDVMIQ
ncbi:hypothetical protein GGQ92_001225 [Gracilibacillus halotolerans]|uniref:DUF4179 domain-containing protein n=1 Tax=Gracilibacillus halotolerans TaxID=74386 RepID=A0A841RKF2_9BACI|nr:DUF4179 domain-containing protein [Gracilibacillus halotolerans]MBB6512442.1 hypothetical protein [Gracilibacillus halotolerans]